MDALDLYPNFTEHDIRTESEVMNCDINRLNMMGVKVGRCDRFLKQMEQRRNELLKQALNKLNYSELYDTFNNKNIRADQLLNLDNDDLRAYITAIYLKIFRTKKSLGIKIGLNFEGMITVF